MKVCGVVLAAGAARRFGRAKQLERWPDANGPTLVERAVKLAAASGVAEVILVTGNQAEKVAALFADSSAYPVPIHPVFNLRWEEGQGFSVAAGVKALPVDCTAALFFLSDQPRLQPHSAQALLKALIELAAPEKAILFPIFGGKRGNPVLFGNFYFEKLAQLEGDVGGRAIVKAYPEAIREVPVDDPAILEDVDTPQDLANLQ